MLAQARVRLKKLHHQGQQEDVRRECSCVHRASPCLRMVHRLAKRSTLDGWALGRDTGERNRGQRQEAAEAGAQDPVQASQQRCLDLRNSGVPKSSGSSL